VNRVFRKDATMASRTLVLLASAALAGCGHTPHDLPARGLAATNVPVVSRADYVFDAAAPTGALGYGEAARLDAWFRSLGLAYGDTIYVDGGGADTARAEVSQLAGSYGLMVASGAPVTASAVQPGSVRVVVSRMVATVPNCPNWSTPAQPNFNNESMSNLGCAVNANLAAMVADPQDLVRGREGDRVTDAVTAARGVDLYRSTAPTGSKGLDAIDTKEDK
jgi:pilus assembly protein CpaD